MMVDKKGVMMDKLWVVTLEELKVVLSVQQLVENLVDMMVL